MSKEYKSLFPAQRDTPCNAESYAVQMRPTAVRKSTALLAQRVVASIVNYIGEDGSFHKMCIHELCNVLRLTLSECTVESTYLVELEGRNRLEHCPTSACMHICVRVCIVKLSVI